MSIEVYRINMEDLLKENNVVILGRNYGKEVSDRLSLYETSKKYDLVHVFFSKKLVVSTSFFLGMFESSFKKYGLNDFCNRFKFLCEDPAMDELIKDYIERLSKDNPKKEWSNPEIREADVCFFNFINDSDMDILATLKVTTSNKEECEENIKSIISDTKMNLPGEWQVSDIIDAIRSSEDVLEVKELETITCYV